MSRNPLAGDLSVVHLNEIRRADVRSWAFDDTDERLSVFAEEVRTADFDATDRPDLVFPNWVVEHFSVSAYQETRSYNPLKVYEDAFVRAFREGVENGSMDPERMTFSDMEALAQGFPPMLPFGNGRKNAVESLRHGLAVHAGKTSAYLSASHTEDRGLAFFVHLTFPFWFPGSGDYRWWRDPAYLRLFATLPSEVEYVLFGRTEVSNTERSPVSCVVYSVETLRVRFGC